MIETFTKEKTIITNVATLWALGLLLLSLSAGWFNLVNQTNNLETDLDTMRATILSLQTDVKANTTQANQAQVQFATITTKLTNIEVTLLEIKAAQ